MCGHPANPGTLQGDKKYDNAGLGALVEASDWAWRGKRERRTSKRRQEDENCRRTGGVEGREWLSTVISTALQGILHCMYARSILDDVENEGGYENKTQKLRVGDERDV